MSNARFDRRLNGLFFAHGATAGLDDLAVFMLVAGVLFLVVTVADRSLRLVGARTTIREPGGAPPPPHAESPAPR